MVGKINYRVYAMLVLVGTTIGCASTNDLRQRMVDHCYAYTSNYDSPEFSSCIQRLERQNAISHGCLRNSMIYLPDTRRGFAYSQCMTNIMRYLTDISLL